MISLLEFLSLLLSIEPIAHHRSSAFIQHTAMIQMITAVLGEIHQPDIKFPRRPPTLHLLDSIKFIGSAAHFCRPHHLIIASLLIRGLVDILILKFAAVMIIHHDIFCHRYPFDGCIRFGCVERSF